MITDDDTHQGSSGRRRIWDSKQQYNETMIVLILAKAIGKENIF